MGQGMGFASAQLAGRDELRRPSVVFAFSKPLKVGGAKIDSVMFTGSTPPPMGFGQAGAFTAASGSVAYLGSGALAEDLILRKLNASDRARSAAIQIADLFGTLCEGILSLLAVAGKF
jgi:hypothetical protein